MTTNYKRGRAAEYFVRDMLRDWGYAVRRSPGSLGPADLVAEKENATTLYVQVVSSVKGKRPWASQDKKATLVAAATVAGATAIVAKVYVPRGSRRRIVLWEYPETGAEE